MRGCNKITTNGLGDLIMLTKLSRAISVAGVIPWGSDAECRILIEAVKGETERPRSNWWKIKFAMLSNNLVETKRSKVLKPLLTL